MIFNASAAVLSLFLLALPSPEPAAAAALHVPLRLPLAEPAPSTTTFLLAVDYFGIRAPGLESSAPGGFWELGAPVGSRSAVHFKAGGAILDGRIESVSGRRDTAGMAGTLEADLSWKLSRAPSAPRGYAGLLLDMTILDIHDPALIQLGAGGGRVEPDTAFSLVFGVPVGLAVPLHSSERWQAWAQAGVTAFLGGATFFSYALPGPSAFGTSRAVHPQLAFDGSVSASYRPWRLAAGLFLSASTSSGNNEGAVYGGASLALRLF